MANRLVRLRPVSTATSTPDAGDGSAQIIHIPINGLADGAGIAARGEIVYITDYSKHVIYRYKKGDSASTIFAGSYGVSGSADGQAGSASFNQPAAIAVDNSGILWVVDAGNALIRRIDGNANVKTVASIPAKGSDQIGSITVDESGTIYFIDSN